MKYIKTFEQTIDKSKIKGLYMSYKNLTELLDLSEYTNLKELNCDNNNLTELPELPNSLEILKCYNNNLTSLPELPNSLEYLDFDNNQLTSLPELPNSLEYLYCKYNKLTSLPELPNSLIYLDCDNNNLPFVNLDEYKKWYKENEHIIKTDGLKYAYQLSYQQNKYNL